MPTVSKRCAHCQATRTRYSIDVTALRRPFARAGCADFPCYDEHAFPWRSSRCTPSLPAVRHLTRSGGFAFFIRSARGRSVRSFARTTRSARPSWSRSSSSPSICRRSASHQLVAELQRLIGVQPRAPGSRPRRLPPACRRRLRISSPNSSPPTRSTSSSASTAPAPPNDALRVAAQLAGALDFANAVQVRHGALHPRDVLLSSDETRLTGIGVAQALEAIGWARRCAVPTRRPN